MDKLLLIIQMDIADDDGPDISYWTANYDDYKDAIPPSHIKIANNRSPSIIKEYINTDVNPILIYPNNFADILEVHDWDNYLNDYEVSQKQDLVDLATPKYGPSYGDIPLRLLTIVRAYRDPLKYVLPIGYPDDKFIYNNLTHFDSLENPAKQEIAKRLRPYKVNASYSDLLKYYGHFESYTDITSDESELEILF